MHKHIYRNQVWDASDCSGTLMLEPCRESFSSLLSYNGYSLILSFFFFSKRKVRPGVQGQASSKPRMELAPHRVRKAVPGTTFCPVPQHGRALVRESGREEERGKMGTVFLRDFPISPQGWQNVLGNTIFLKGTGGKSFFLEWSHVFLNPSGFLNLQANTNT